MRLNLSEWFHTDECPAQWEIEFLHALYVHAQQWQHLGISFDDMLMQRDDSLLTVAFDVSSKEYRKVLRMLRIDFYGTRILLGDDETYQLVTDLNPQNLNVISFEDINGTPQAFADFAAQWLLREASRAIELHEWGNSRSYHRRWILADTGQCVSMSDFHCKMRGELGPPDRVTIVHPPQNKR